MEQCTETWDCRRCGTTSTRPLVRGTKPKWCSTRCRDLAGLDARAKAAGASCHQCGTGLTGYQTKYCAQSCRLAATPTRQAPAPPVKQAPRPIFISGQCAWCDAPFLVRTASTGSSPMYCTAACKDRAKGARRRAAECSASGVFTWSEVTRLWIDLGKTCAYCREYVSNGDLQPDHVVPLSKGGSNSITNVVPSCGPCNASKNDLTLEAWRDRRARLGLPIRTIDPRLQHLTFLLVA